MLHTYSHNLYSIHLCSRSSVAPQLRESIPSQLALSGTIIHMAWSLNFWWSPNGVNFSPSEFLEKTWWKIDILYFHFWNGVEVATRNKQWYMRCPDSLIRWAQKLVVATHVILQSDVGSFCNPSLRFAPSKKSLDFSESAALDVATVDPRILFEFSASLRWRRAWFQALICRKPLMGTLKSKNRSLGS